MKAQSIELVRPMSGIVGWPKCRLMLGLLLFIGQAGAQQFTEIVPGLPNYPQTCVAWGDYDGDGDVDVLVAGLGSHDVATTKIYKNTGGVFNESGISLLGLSRATAAWGDFDNDGRLDLAMTGLTSAGLATTVIYHNTGSNFTALSGNFLGVFAGNVAWGDYDGDGRLDLLVTGITSPNTSGRAFTRLYHNDGNGVFSAVSHPFPNCYLGAVAWGDYNNDGRLDVIIAGAMDTGGLVATIWRNDGDGHFTDGGADLPGLDLGYAAWGDYDNDGNLDLLLGGNSLDGYIARIYRNTGSSFTNINAGLLGVIWASAAWGDYDNDGDLDVMLMGYDPVAQLPVSRLYRNDAGSFVDSGQTFHNLYLGTLSWVDYNNDGNLDLLLAGNGGGFESISLYRNNNLVTNTVPAAPTTLTVTNFGPTATLSWNAPADAQTPLLGLSYNVRVGTTPGGTDIVSPQAGATGYRRVVALGNVGNNRTMQVANLKPGSHYFWSVQALDTTFAGGPFAAEGSFILPTPAAPSIRSIRATTNGFQLQLDGTPGWSYGILASTNNLTTNISAWVRLATGTADGTGRLSYTDTNSNVPGRFYRGAYP